MATPIQPTTAPTSGPVPTPVPGDDAEIRALAAQLVSSATPSKPPLSLSQATIVDTDPNGTPPTASITIAGSSTQVDAVRYMSGYMPVAGDTVSVLIQNGSVLILGHTVDIGTANATTGGWAIPTLSSGFTTNGNSNGPVKYRLVVDNGLFKMQWTGAIAHTGSNTAIVSGGNVLATQFRPSTKVSVATARDPAGGANSVGLDFDTDGSVTLTGPIVGRTSGGSSQSHTHAMGTSDVQLSGYLSQAGSDLGHAHGLGTSGGQSVSHTHDTNTAAPTWISFHNIEYFL